MARSSHASSSRSAARAASASPAARKRGSSSSQAPRARVVRTGLAHGSHGGPGCYYTKRLGNPSGSPTEPQMQDGRYSTFLSLTGDGIARFELDSPLEIYLPEEDQVRHLLVHARVAECNELFAGLYGRQHTEMMGLALG